MKSSLTFCGILMAVCLLCSDASDSHSLWGKKVKFAGPRCLWQLNPNTAVPALKELTVCTLLRFTIVTEWTGFVYKAPGGRRIELGLQGTGGNVSVFLFEKQVNLKNQLTSGKWYSICVTWSGRTQNLRVYINGDSKVEVLLDPPSSQHLAPNGTLTLGRSHFVSNGGVQLESGKELMGEIGLFRMWAREWSAEEIKGESCADGDVLSWDIRQWEYKCPPPVPDSSLHCAWSLYKIKMWTFMDLPQRAGNCPVSLEKVTRNWLENIFPRNIVVHDISVSSPSRSCHVVNNSAALHMQQPQESWAFSVCDKCFSSEAYVSVDPATPVDMVQANIIALLNVTFSSENLNLTADTYSISILPIESFPAESEPAPTISTAATTTVETGPTQSLQTRPGNVSTTGGPLDLNETAVGPDKFFRVNLNLILTGSPTNPQDVVKKWEQLEGNRTMTVLNFIIKEDDRRDMGQGLMITPSQQRKYNCTFHVQEYNINTVEITKDLIYAALTSKYESDSYIIQSTAVLIKQIVPEDCLEESTSTIYGEYFWDTTFPEVTREMVCRKPKSERAYRHCKLDIETDKTSWAEPNMTNCKPLVTISDLENITVTASNAGEVVDMIQGLVDDQLGNSPELSSSDLGAVVEKLNEVVDVSNIKPTVGADIVNIVADILLSKTEITPVAGIVLNLTEKMGNHMDFEDESASVTAPSLALSMVNIAPGEFSGLTFGVSSISPVHNPEIFIDPCFVSEPLPDSDATISLPAALHDLFPPGEVKRTRIQFQFYGTAELFQDPDINNETESTTALNSYIVSASVNSSHISNLKDPVVVTLNHQRAKQQNDNVRCVFWDFRRNAGQGGWNSRGCETRSISPNQTSCRCDHLTHFAVLLDIFKGDISETDSQVLTVISYLGCGISSIFLGITLLTYLAFDKLRRDYPSKILINLSAALLGLCMLFLLDSWLSSFSNYGLCIATAASLHYFLLASFTWMGLEAVHMYLALVKVFNIYVPYYILKFCAVGWGIPLVIVSLILAIDKDAYGSTVPEMANVALQSTDQFCWLQNDVYIYVTVVAFFLLILLCNISVFIVVLIQIKQMRVNNSSANNRTSLQNLRAVASLTVLLGLTWGMGFFSVGPGRVAMLYLFCIFNTLQGFFIFLFHCLMKENVRKQWRDLCCGHLRRNDHSDWSRSVSVGGGHGKNNILVNSDSVASDNTTTRKVSDSSTGSPPNNHQMA
ncbi:adhesion G-protein coupled receptor G4 isoform X2 [Notolabrus celidotus]|uniref:adhesion G-protein coupled receptor G4 isoform X2 n=1 Tax=Notolabrus celidotus TaxID=1203425 RepID=UPI0014905369|nr:adhesion G-protein coupled receptor G4 isoform X2 [Notolabrus celidotus]